MRKIGDFLRKKEAWAIVAILLIFLLFWPFFADFDVRGRMYCDDYNDKLQLCNIPTTGTQECRKPRYATLIGILRSDIGRLMEYRLDVVGGVKKIMGVRDNRYCL